MEINVQDVLDMAEETGKLAFFDIEAANLKADYGSILVASVKPFGEKPVSFSVDTVGNDRSLVGALRDELEKYVVVCGYYSRGFDWPYIRSRLLKYNMRDIVMPLHLDLYFTLKPKMLTSRRSQAHLLNWLGTDQQKMTVSADVWAQVTSNPTKNLPLLIKRCESDCAGLEALYSKTRHLIKEIKH